MPRLTSNLDNSQEIPYFLWSEDTTVEEFRAILASEDNPERILYIARLLREARISDVWNFLTPQQVADAFEEAAPHLGRKRDFWKYLLSVWKKNGAIL